MELTTKSSSIAFFIELLVLILVEYTSSIFNLSSEILRLSENPLNPHLVAE